MRWMVTMVLVGLTASSARAQARGPRTAPPLPAPGQAVTVSGGGLDPATAQQIRDAVAEARKALVRLKEVQNARCESVKERADLAADQVDAKLERISLALEKAAGQPAQVQVVSPSSPPLVQPVVVIERVDEQGEVEPPFLSVGEVDRLSQAVAAESFAEDQLRVLRLGLSGVPVQVNDAKGLLARFNFGEDKLKALQLLTPHLYDRQNAYQLIEAFTFSDDKDAARRILSR